MQQVGVSRKETSMLAQERSSSQINAESRHVEYDDRGNADFFFLRTPWMKVVIERDTLDASVYFAKTAHVYCVLHTSDIWDVKFRAANSRASRSFYIGDIEIIGRYDPRHLS